MESGNRGRQKCPQPRAVCGKVGGINIQNPSSLLHIWLMLAWETKWKDFVQKYLKTFCAKVSKKPLPCLNYLELDPGLKVL